ncbi:MAG: RnfABCDGE type electron transport complex subunit B [Casimicrobiaceae bacterium]|nr:RnfABCDGE type electron transport complex subunit B [Casimicrobiaceae bacterium]MDW8311492.1 RnfABCDGE type electron transport complex subunit B [Burkholderiales bacterium]
MKPSVAHRPEQLERIEVCLPQTQCRRCGYADCHAYAEAIHAGEAGIDRCPPGGEATRRALHELLGLAGDVPGLASDVEAYAPEHVARIDETLCIGCAQCLPECPTDAIVGAAKRVHTVIAEACTGCELCRIACPVVDCISLVPQASFANRAYATLETRAEQSAWLRTRYAAHRARWAAVEEAGAAELAAPADPALREAATKRAVLASVLERARLRLKTAAAGSNDPGHATSRVASTGTDAAQAGQRP